MAHRVKILACSASDKLANEIADCYGLQIAKFEKQGFSDGEFQISINETVRGCDVFIIQSTIPPSDNLMEMLLMIDAAKRASAHKIIAVIPYFGWARQDRKDKPRVAIGAKLVANMLVSAGVNRVMTMDLHADQIQGFFEVPVDHLFASTLFAPYLKSKKTDKLIIAAPDAGGSKRANAYAKYLDVDLALCYKQRKKANKIESMTIIGDVEGKDVVIIDDMIDTAGTLTMSAQLFMDHGAKSVSACCTHALLSGPAHERIENSVLKELVVTNTIPLKRKNKKIKVLSVANLFSDVMEQHVNLKSISKHFLFAN
ncbi:MAG: ribose-phosphate pyrophosphokinase [Bacteroidota bacterium]|nr:ribose-phosphate pyrophosphokinase [Bacteroidota bacterium]GIR58722.1 MAG: ribose-phosphate pyrophosphokinase [Crocinitomicaceae bacterium]MEC7005419.1 ribose-phosphate pyrophosphokinase [Bacteroidota bacterium]MEC7063081.1 ribose-phosphate pyrophosphokinase [Bacteroidota bacterium]MEC7083512.1 ribose-phosphate pyrophosphokinase [Bacteroidota bacterium]|tara:strand:+ start:5687 stop:6625 length:939 start_codon:yes stop_codon:yes gene_type:complete